MGDKNAGCRPLGASGVRLAAPSDHPSIGTPSFRAARLTISREPRSGGLEGCAIMIHRAFEMLDGDGGWHNGV